MNRRILSAILCLVLVLSFMPAAVFGADEGSVLYNVNVLVSGQGIASADKSQAAAGDTVTLSAEAAQGYHLTGWNVPGVNVVDGSFTMPEEDVTATAIFQEHEFVLESTDDAFLRSAADCESAAVYYMSCSCGAAGEETFESGSALGHSYGDFEPADSENHSAVCANDSSHVLTEAHDFSGNVCIACGYELSPEYTLSAENGSEWTMGSESGLSFASNVPADKFEGAELDGSLLPGDSYTAAGEQTAITLGAALLEGLAEGAHTLRINAADGAAEARFTVSAAEPETGYIYLTKMFEGIDTDEEEFVHRVGFVVENASGSFSRSLTLGRDFRDNNGVFTTEIEVEPDSYTVTEVNYLTDKLDVKVFADAAGIREMKDSAAVSVSAGESCPIIFTNAYSEKTGKLNITKTVTGDLMDKDVAGLVSFNVQSSDGSYDKTFKLGEDFALTADGARSLELELEPGSYTVTENGYNINGYTVNVVSTVNGQTGAAAAAADVEADGTAVVTFENNYREIPARITITKTVSGDLAMDKVQPTLGFTVKSADGSVNMTLSAANDFILADGKLIRTIEVKSGTYTITETGFEIKNYKTASSFTVAGNKSSGSSVTFAAERNSDVTVDVQNVYTKKVGNLTVAKVVAGMEAELNRAFSFKVTLSDRSINGTYGGMSFNGGVAEFSLKHNEIRTATGLPEGITYTVTETDYSSDGYKTSKTGDIGTIAEAQNARATFTNVKGYVPPPAPQTGDESNIFLWISLMAVSAGALAATVLIGKKKKNGTH